ncbi:FecR family protein [Aurantiacibacter flavus]|uniref:FecR domain-containing protein n=1 Tax=Aurantiacibacter flavus TaxID=3145232 RepID=A0ABV0CWP8_9SPHN
MAPPPPETSPDDDVRLAAAEWFARMRDPDAERHRAEFDTWYRADPAHAAAYNRMRLRWDQSRLVGHTPSGQGRKGLPAPPRRRFRLRALALAAAFVAMLVLGAVLISAWSTLPDAGPGAQIAASDTLETPRGDIRRVSLADGSVVTLDSESRISVAFTSGERRLRLVAGRARFEVAHDAGRPFIVAAGGGEVVATGTRFDVSLIGNQPRVRLIQGSVEIRRSKSGAAGDAAASAVRLKPGQMALVDRPVPPETAPVAGESWVSGTLSFENAPLENVLAEANRYTARQVRLGDPGLGRLRFTGGFRAGDTDQLAQALATAFGLRVDHDPQGNPVLMRP